MPIKWILDFKSQNVFDMYLGIQLTTNEQTVFTFSYLAKYNHNNSVGHRTKQTPELALARG